MPNSPITSATNRGVDQPKVWLWCTVPHTFWHRSKNDVGQWKCRTYSNMSHLWIIHSIWGFGLVPSLIFETKSWILPKKIVEAFLKKFWFELKLKTLIQNVQKVNIWALISHQSQIEYFHPLNSGLHSEMLLHRSSEKANWPLSQNPTRQTKSRALILFSTPGFYVTTHITEISKRNWPFWSMHLLHSLQ